MIRDESRKTDGAPSSDTVWSSLRWWPTLLGIALATFIAFDMSGGSALAPVVAAAGVVYLGAAALRKPGAAWPLFVGTFLVISATRVGVLAVDAITTGSTRSSHGQWPSSAACSAPCLRS
ncbi:MAG TPA: hypothetical protein VIR54_06710 [Vicinamibacterales bacterium]